MKKIILTLTVALAIFSSCKDEPKGPAKINVDIQGAEISEATVLLNGVIKDRVLQIDVSDNHFEKEINITSPKIGMIAIGDQGLFKVIFVNPGVETKINVDAKTGTFTFTGSDSINQNLLNEFTNISERITAYSKKGTLGMSWEEAEKFVLDRKGELIQISSKVDNDFLKNWMEYSTQYLVSTFFPRYYELNNNQEYLEKMKLMDPSLEFPVQEIPKRFLSIGDFNPYNPMMIEVTNDIELDISSAYILEKRIENSEFKAELLPMYKDILANKITDSNLWDQFASSAYMKYGTQTPEWNEFFDMIYAKIQNTDIKTLLDELFAKRKEKQAKIDNLTNLEVLPFELEDINGNKHLMSQFAGKYVYIDIWATWCGPCKAEIPSLKKREEAFKGQNLEFVSISFDKNQEDWRNFVKKEELTGTQLIVGENMQKVMDYYMISGFPTFILLGPDGKILKYDFIRPSNENFEEILKDIIKG